MNATRQGGFSMMIVVVCIALAGISLGILASASKVMYLETRRMYFEAHDRNLRASGLAWANRNAAAIDRLPAKGKVLNVEAMNVPDGGLKLAPAEAGAGLAGQRCVTIHTTCGTARGHIRRNRDYLIGK